MELLSGVPVAVAVTATELPAVATAVGRCALVEALASHCVGPLQLDEAINQFVQHPKAAHYSVKVVCANCSRSTTQIRRSIEALLNAQPEPSRPGKPPVTRGTDASAGSVCRVFAVVFGPDERCIVGLEQARGGVLLTSTLQAHIGTGTAPA